MTNSYSKPEALDTREVEVIIVEMPPVDDCTVYLTDFNHSTKNVTPDIYQATRFMYDGDEELLEEAAVIAKAVGGIPRRLVISYVVSAFPPGTVDILMREGEKQWKFK